MEGSTYNIKKVKEKRDHLEMFRNRMLNTPNLKGAFMDYDITCSLETFFHRLCSSAREYIIKHENSKIPNEVETKEE